MKVRHAVECRVCFTTLVYFTFVAMCEWVGQMGNLLAWVQNLFWKQEMELAIVGLQNAGKSTFVQVITVRGKFTIFLIVDE